MSVIPARRQAPPAATPRHCGVSGAGFRSITRSPPRIGNADAATQTRPKTIALRGVSFVCEELIRVPSRSRPLRHSGYRGRLVQFGDGTRRRDVTDTTQERIQTTAAAAKFIYNSLKQSVLSPARSSK